MIKPILYHSFEEKALLEADMASKLTPAQKKRVAKVWITIASATRLVEEKKRVRTNDLVLSKLAINRAVDRDDIQKLEIIRNASNPISISATKKKSPFLKRKSGIDTRSFKH